MPVNVTRSSTLSNDIDGDGVADVGEALTIRVRITNLNAANLTNLQLFDSQNGLNIDPASVKITPIAFDDSLPTITGNTPYTFSKAAILGNDVDPNDPSATFTVQLGAGTSGTIVDNGDGTLTFTPATGFQGTASFTYTVTNTHQGESSVSTATVSLNVSGQIWYVDSGYSGVNGTADGSYLKPFTSLTQLNGVTGDGTTNDDVDAINDSIFVYNRGSTYTGGIVLEAGQKFYGDGHAITVNGISLGDTGANGIANSTISATTGTVITLSTDNSVYGVTINANGAGVTGLADGNGSVSSTTSSQGLVIDETSFTGSGRAIDIDQGGKLNVDLDSLSSGGATGEAIQLAGTASSGIGLITGTFNATTGIIQSATGQGFLIGVAGGGTASSGGDLAITYGGAITNPTGSAVEVQDRTGGTVTFSGTITDGSASGNAGILLDGNAGTISFNGQTFISNGAGNGVQVTNNSGTVTFNAAGNGLDITTTSGTGVLASGGGTLNIVGAGNSITSTNATALSVQGVTIGASGLTFQSISAGNSDAGADPVNGIILANTGTSGGLSVTGDSGSVNNSSGGIIQNTTGDGIRLTNTRGVSLDQSNIHDTGISGIDGTAVTNFSFTNGTINNSGLSGATASAGNIAFNDIVSGINNIDGTVTITGNTLNNAYNSGIQIYNESGTISNINISNNNLNASGNTATSKGSGIQIDINGSAGSAAAVTAGNVNNNVINDFASGAGIQFQGGNGAQGTAATLGTYSTTPGTGTLIQIANNQVGLTSGGTPLGTNGIVAGVTGTGQGNFSITGNTVQHFLGQGIAAFGGNRANVSFDVSANNVDGTDNIANSQGISVGSQLGGADATQNGTIRAIINGNTVSGMEGNGIFAGVTNSYNTGYFRITANVVGNPQGAGFRSGISVVSGTTAGDTTLFLEISGNTSGSIGSGQPGISLRKQGSVAGVNEFNIEGLPNNPATHGQVESYVSSLNLNSVQGFGNDGSTPSRVLSVSGQLYQPGTVSFAQYVPINSLALLDHGYDLALGHTRISNGSALLKLSGDPRDLDGVVLANDEPASQPGIAGVPGAIGLYVTEPAPAELPGIVPAVEMDGNVLTQAKLNIVVASAIARWAAAGASDAQIAAMQAVKVELTDMMGVQVGVASTGLIQIDDDAATHGWFIDATPGEDAEFAGAGTRLDATIDGGAAGRIDLLTVLMHELGHQIGLDDGYTAGGAVDLMYGYINAGERRLPGVGEAAWGTGHAPVHDAYVLSPVAVVGTLPVGKAVDITYVGTVTAPAGAGLIASLTNIATASYVGGTTASTAEVTAIDSLTLGDRVFLDANKNGVFDAGEGLAGVSLTLFADTNGNGAYDDGTDLAISYIDNNSNGVFDPAGDTPATAGTPGAIALTVTSGANGVYSFGNLAAGDYIVRVNASNFTGGGALTGRRAVGATSDPDNNVDSDSNATQFLLGQAGTYAASQAITLSFNNEPTAGTGNDTNNTLDLGFVQPNQAPTIANLQGDSSTYAEGGLPIVRIDVGTNAVVSDPDSGNFNGGSLTVSISSGFVAASDLIDIVQDGVVSISGGNVSVNGLLIGTVTGNNTPGQGTMVLTFTTDDATPARVQAVVQRLFYTSGSPDDPVAGTRGLTVTLVDGDGTADGGVDRSSYTPTVTVVATNDAPVNTVPAAQTTAEDASRSFGTANGNRISITDVDAGSANVQVTIGVAHGTLTLSGVGGLTFSVGDGTTDATMTFQGTISAINTALNNLVYAPTQNYNGADTLTITTSDLGNSGSGGALTDTDIVAITVTALNDAPSGTDGAVAVNEDTRLVLSAANFGFTDVDGDSFDAVRISTVPAGGNLYFDSDGAGGSLGQLLVAGDIVGIAQINAGQLVYVPNANVNGADSFTFQVRDNGPVGSGNFNLDPTPNTLTINVAAVDDLPVAVADSGTTPETTSTTGNVLTNDTDIDGGPKTVSAVNGVTASVGTQITLASGALLTLNADGTYSYNPNGKFAYLVSAATAAATGALDSQATDTFTYTLNGGSTATVTVTVTGVDGAGSELRGDAGNNIINGTPQPDLFNLSQGGSDTANGGDGSDGFYMGGALDAGDRIDGQGGTFDQVGLQGNYGSLVLSADTIRNIESLVFLPGNDTRFGAPGGQSFVYNVTLNDGNVAAGQYLTVTANTLQASESVSFNASGEIDGAIVYYGGAGTDSVIGSQQNDGFFFGEGAFGATDFINGQGGSLDQLALQGNYTVTFGVNQLASIENLVLISAHDVRLPSTTNYTYNITMNDANLFAGQLFAVSANTLIAGENLTFNASAEQSALITVYSGGGNDTLTLGQGADRAFGGAGNDTINGNGGADQIYGGGGADQLSGGAGNDTFFYLAVGDSTAASQDRILDFSLGDHIDVASLGGLQFVTGAFTGARQLHVTSQGGGNYLVEAETTGDGLADLSVLVTSDHALTAADFVGVTQNPPGAFHLPITPVDMTAGAADDGGRLGLGLFDQQFAPLTQDDATGLHVWHPSITEVLPELPVATGIA